MNTYELVPSSIESEMIIYKALDMDYHRLEAKAFGKKENVIIRDVETIKNEHVYI